MATARVGTPHLRGAQEFFYSTSPVRRRRSLAGGIVAAVAMAALVNSLAVSSTSGATPSSHLWHHRPTTITTTTASRLTAAPPTTTTTAAPPTTTTTATPPTTTTTAAPPTTTTTAAPPTIQSTPCSSPTSTDPSGVAMPTTSPAGWNLIYSDNFNTNVAAGSWPTSAYSASWTAYPTPWTDTSGAGSYETTNISVSNSCLILHLSTVGNTVQVAAPVPILPGNGPYQGMFKGQLYGMYSVCFRADAGVNGFKTAWLLWPDNNTWADGEIDFPEGDLASTIGGYDHEVGNPSANALAAVTGDTYTSWHVATIEWTAAGVTFILDGKVIGTSSMSPSVPMHWVLQTETDGGAPAASVAGNVYIDWVAVYSPAS